MACSCGDKRPSAMEELMHKPLQINYTSQQIFGVEGYKALVDTDISDLYKNVHELECSYRITNEYLTRCFKDQLKLFPKVTNGRELPKVELISQFIPNGLDS